MRFIVVTLSVTCLLLLKMGYATNTASAKENCRSVHKAIVFYRKATWNWQDEFGIKHSKFSKRTLASSCDYGRWAAKLWRSRAWKLREVYRRYEHADSNFRSAALVAHTIFPKITTDRLWYRASVEGGHGQWYCNHYGSGACGWFQFMEGTYYGRSGEAFLEARRRGFPIPWKFNSWYSMLGQNITAAYMFSIGLECAGEGWAASC